MEFRRDVLGRVPVSFGVVDADVEQEGSEVEVEQVGSFFFSTRFCQNFVCQSGVPESGSGVWEGRWSLTGLLRSTILLKYSSSVSYGRRPDMFTFGEGWFVDENW